MDQHVNDSNLGSSVVPDFSFAFDNKKFSDRKLRIEIMQDLQRQSHENKDTSCQDDCSNKMDCSNSVSKVRSIYINSAILAAKSLFFMKLFSNGMKESKERDVTVRISCSEEMAFMDLLQFMYKGTLEAHSTAELLDVLMVADKFDIESCVDHCTRALQNSSLWTIESASLCLQLPPILLTNPVVLLAKWFLILCFEHNHQKDKLLLEEELLNLPLSAMEVILSTDEFARLVSEDVMHDFVIKWARNHYPDVDERREIFRNKLWHLIRFQNMSHQKRVVLSSNDLDNVCTTKSVFMKAEIPDKIVTFKRRGYQQSLMPLTVEEYDAPLPRCKSVFTLHTDDCQLLQSRPVLYFENFMFQGFKFQPLASRYAEKDGFSIDFHIIHPKLREEDYNGSEALDHNNVGGQVGDTENNGEIVIELEVLSKGDLEVQEFVKQYKFEFPRNLRSRGVYVKGDNVYAPELTSRFFISDNIYFRLWVTLHP